MLGVLDDVFNGGQAAQLKCVVDDQHALQAVLMHQRLSFVQRRAFLHGDQALLRRHDVAQRDVEPVFEAQIAVGDDTHQLAALDDGQAGEAMLTLQGRSEEHTSELQSLMRNSDAGVCLKKKKKKQKEDKK